MLAMVYVCAYDLFYVSCMYGNNIVIVIVIIINIIILHEIHRIFVNMAFEQAEQLLINCDSTVPMWRHDDAGEAKYCSTVISWWRHQMETFSALLAICAGNSPVPGEFPARRPVMRSFDVIFDLHLNKRSSKQWQGW